MKKILLTASIALNICYAANVLANKPECPTADQLRSEWSTSSIANVEKDGDEVTFHQAPHTYGTNATWYVNITVRNTNVDHALESASQAVKTARFLGGGVTPWGFYSCGYQSPNRQMIYAYANKQL